MKIAILTATYNRENLLGRLYGSLLAQSSNDFTWIVVDDGSTDNTEKAVKEFTEQNKIDIRYFKKKNCGKSAALNYGFENNPDIDFFAVVDSDDWLYVNAVETIKAKAGYYSKAESVGAIFFKYSDKNGKPMYDSSLNCLKTEKCMSRYDHDASYVKEDGCIGYFSKVTKKYRYPEFAGETYVGPIVIQMMMAKEFTIAFTQEYIGYAEYQEGGISRSGRKLRLRNPYGMICYCRLLQSPENRNRKSRLKYCIEAQAYAQHSGITKQDLASRGIDPGCLKDWAKAPGKVLEKIWKRK